MKAVDLFAGPGGWDVAAERLGLDVVGVEWDHAACETRRAVGHRTVEADVESIRFPRSFAHQHFSASADGLIASPPCQTFSSAGSGAGRAIIPDLAAIARSRFGMPSEHAHHAQAVIEDADPRSLLVLEPIRWIQALAPRWICLEQVKEVLPIWEAYAEGLAALGYSVWTGKLTSERYGVPQTRVRAILVASLDGEVGEPRPTHRRYVAPKRDRKDMHTLFGEETPDRGRIVAPGDEDLEPWVSMAEALGWPEDLEVHGERGAGMIERHGERRPRLGCEPAPTVTGSGRRGGGPRWRIVTQHNASWPFERPATTVACDPRVSPPGFRGRPSDYDADGKFIGERSMDNAIRVTEREAAILQSFPADYPWQGNKGKRFEQIGNAVPPMLAGAVLGEVLR